MISRHLGVQKWLILHKLHSCVMAKSTTVLTGIGKCKIAVGGLLISMSLVSVVACPIHMSYHWGHFMASISKRFQKLRCRGKITRPSLYKFAMFLNLGGSWGIVVPRNCEYSNTGILRCHFTVKHSIKTRWDRTMPWVLPRIRCGCVS